MKTKEEKKSIGYRILYAIAYALSLLPFPVLYLFADLLYVVAYYIVRYRRDVVWKNLKNSFPQKSEKELTVIEKKFYRHLADYFVETLKTLTISDKEVRKRMKFVNPEIINRFTNNGSSCILSLGHYGNWEWVPSIGLYLMPDVAQGLVYKELRSKAFDALFLKIRSRFSPRPIEMRNVFRKMIRLNNDGEKMVIGFLSDQRPAPNLDHYWIKFLNQDTPVQTGMERIARHLHYAIVYLDIEKVKRGYYEGKFKIITADASQEPEFVIMKRYMQKLEETVLREPAYYLWSHNRWKFTKKPEA